MITIGLVSVTFIQFNRQFSHSGSVYQFTGISLGPKLGFLSGWTLFLTYLAFTIIDSFLKEKAAAVEAVFGKGKLVLFSFHPEFGSPVTGSWEASPTHLLLLNTILYLGSTAASSR